MFTREAWGSGDGTQTLGGLTWVQHQSLNCRICVLAAEHTGAQCGVRGGAGGTRSPNHPRRRSAAGLTR